MTPWADAGDLASTACSASVAEVDPGVVDAALEYASEVLNALTGGVWPGEQVDVIRPCSPLRSLGADPGHTYGLSGEGWGGSGWCGCASPTICNCAAPGLVPLPGHPVVTVDEVVVDGYVLDPTEYRVSGSYLVRVDGGTWPCCQDWTVEGDQAGGFQVAYTWGEGPPASGVHAAAVLACEMLKGQGSVTGACRLPQRVTSITRQGVSMTLLDPMAMFPEGRTGLPEVDLWLESLRYAQVHRQATVLVPGSRRRNLRDP